MDQGRVPDSGGTLANDQSQDSSITKQPMDFFLVVLLLNQERLHMPTGAKLTVEN